MIECEFCGEKAEIAIVYSYEIVYACKKCLE